jgi:hypothetical protein
MRCAAPSLGARPEFHIEFARKERTAFTSILAVLAWIPSMDSLEFLAFTPSTDSWHES